MRWPWSRSERREASAEGSYTDLLIRALSGRARGEDITSRETAVVVNVATFAARCFAAATVGPAGPLADAVRRVSADAARRLVLDGECLFFPTFDGPGPPRLVPVSSFHVVGGADPASWVYRIDLYGPTSNSTLYRPAGDVLHVRLNSEAHVPWRGKPSHDTETGRALAAIESHERYESAGPHGFILPTPSRDNADEFEELVAAIGKLRGETFLIDHQQQGRTLAPGQDYKPSRIGWAPTPGSAEMRTAIELSVGTSLGMPVELLASSSSSASREGFRRALHSLIRPLARMIEEELADKLGVPLMYDFTMLAAADIMGRARSAASLVTAGWSREAAERVTGLGE